MSIGVCGKIELDKNQDIVNISYQIQTFSIQNKIGCKLGGNVSEKVFQLYGYYTNNDLYFELMDSPIDNYADELFMPNFSSEKDSSITDENILYANLKTVQNFFANIFNIEGIKSIMVDVNYFFKENNDYARIHISEFVDYMYEQFEKEDFFEPSVSVIINKKKD